MAESEARVPLSQDEHMMLLRGWAPKGDRFLCVAWPLENDNLLPAGMFQLLCQLRISGQPNAKTL